MNLRSVFFPIFVSLPALSLSAWGCSSSSYSSPSEGAGGEGPVEGPEDEAEEDPSDGPTPVVVIGGASGNGEKCEVGAVDVPDAEQIDENCDGIDGTIDGAIFVSPLGSDEDDGSMTWPVATLTEAVARATAEGKDVYACSATYEENLVIAEGVRIYGGFACEDEWKRTKTPAEVAPQEGLPLSIEDLEEGANPTVIENFLFRAKDASEEGQSSIAGRVVRSHDVQLSRVEFVAGKGADASAAEAAPVHSKAGIGGAAGSSAASWNAMFGSDCYIEDTSHCGDGICIPKVTWKASCKGIADNQPKAWRCTGTCGNTTTCETDDGATIDVSRSYGGHGSTAYSSPRTNPGTGQRLSNAPGAGQAGKHGDPAGSGFGLIDESGQYIASNVGEIGKFGGVGKNGRGGDGAPNKYGNGDLTFDQVGGAGGASGMPGCGGYPGRAGLAGGASIGLIVVDSDLILERVTVITADGGVGGAATQGTAGQTGGPGGNGGASRHEDGTHAGGSTWGGKNGQKGGNGGHGGDGGAGGGGPSVGIVVIGDEPSLKAMSFDIGLGGEGGLPLEGSSAGKGAAGISEDVYVVGGE